MSNAWDCGGNDHGEFALGPTILMMKKTAEGEQSNCRILVSRHSLVVQGMVEVVGLCSNKIHAHTGYANPAKSAVVGACNPPNPDTCTYCQARPG